MKIVFCGTSEFAVPILKAIKSQTCWDVVLVISESAKPAGRKNHLADSPVTQTAKKLNLKLATPASIKDIKSDIENLKPDIMVVVAYGQILPRDILETPKLGTVNVHPSLLPKLRGPAPIQAALAQGLTETGVSLMLIDEKVDHGPIISQESFLIGENENYLTLEYQLAQIGASMLVRDLPKYVLGEIKSKAQDHAEATFTKLIKKENGLVDWSKSADQIYNLWRAYLKWPGIYTFFKDKSGVTIRLKLIEIQKCSTLSVKQKQLGEVFLDESKNLYIACREGAVKVIRLQPENSKILASAEFLNGHREFLQQILS